LINKELTLEVRTKSGELRKSEQVVVIAVPERPGERPLVVLGEPGEPSRVLQSPHESEGILLALDIVDYDDDGAVVLSGRSEPGATLRAYADNELIGDVKADEDGYWTIRPGTPLAPGVYALRIDQINDQGRVLARVEVPFERAEVSDILAAVAKGGGRIVVQPGNSLWRIARRVYGSGFEHTIIYDANSDQIRDPDLIYPGQIFDLPKKYEVDEEIHLLID
jgi:nucleoid-associated protein YgaU